MVYKFRNPRIGFRDISHITRRQRQSEKLWWNKEIEALAEEKRQAYIIIRLSSKQQKDRDEYLELKRITRRTTVKAKREMWDKKCQEINTYLGGRKCTETWKFLSKIRTNERKNKHPINIHTKMEKVLWGTTNRK
ncbi:unnamed protein product [Diabrotica balteata]|uniref:Uncharacterized protein n=1 Tax=Diabrotica balteata TaxID=107213 RepID=A0A9N9SUY4_DIABA|nr:unnamed protein product [Diabrotica balteata]